MIDTPMADTAQHMQAFVAYWRTLKGDEKGESQVFLDRLFQAFGNNRVDVTREAAGSVARVPNSVIARGEDRPRAQRFLLPCVMAMFAEDFELIPRGFFTELADDARQG